MAWSWEADDYDINDPNESGLLTFVRTNGDCLCEMCRQPLYRHYQPYRVTCGTMVVDCYRRFWKL